MTSWTNNLELTSAATEWRDAWPTGNGTLGALVYGGVPEETIVFNHEALWTAGRTDKLPDVSKLLPELRTMMDRGDYVRANTLYSDQLRKDGYDPAISYFPPAGKLVLLETTSLGSPTHYSRKLNLVSGEVVVAWEDSKGKNTRSCFVSSVDGAFHLFLPGGKKDLRSWTLRVDAPVVKTSFDLHNKMMKLYCQDFKGSRWSLEVKLCLDRGTVTEDMGTLTIKTEGDVHLIVQVLIDDNNTNKYKKIGEDQVQLTYFESRSQHEVVFKDLIESMSLELDNPSMKKVQTMFDYGRYLLISSTGRLPPNLQGLWNGDEVPIWNSFYMANENVQMMHWQCLSGGLGSLLLPLFDYYENLIDDFRTNAQHLYGCRGIWIPADSAPDSGLLKDLQSHIIYWTGAAAWIASIFYDFYEFTQDLQFLINRAYPFMKETALFYEDFLLKDETGHLVFVPSVSPENAPEMYNKEKKMDADVSISINATMDVALCKELLQHLLETGPYVNETEQQMQIWRSMIERLPSYEKSEHGCFREWLHSDFPDNHYHRHVSHLYPFFPGSEIRVDSSMASAIRRSTDQRLAVGMREQTGWSLVHLSAIYARLGDGDRAMECLEVLQEFCVGTNYFTYHNDWRNQGVCQAQPIGFENRVFQIDANLGYPTVILEMLVQSRKGRIELLRGLPKALPSGRASGIRCRGQVTVDIDWSKESVKIVLLSPIEQNLILVCYGKDAWGPREISLVANSPHHLIFTN